MRKEFGAGGRFDIFLDSANTKRSAETEFSNIFLVFSLGSFLHYSLKAPQPKHFFVLSCEVRCCFRRICRRSEN